MKPADFLDAKKKGHKALELVMQDVLDGMEQLALMEGYGKFSCCFEILSVENPAADTDLDYHRLKDAS